MIPDPELLPADPSADYLPVRQWPMPTRCWIDAEHIGHEVKPDGIDTTEYIRADLVQEVAERYVVRLLMPKDAFANPDDPAFRAILDETLRRLGATRKMINLTGDAA